MLEEVALELLGLSSCLPDGLEERDPFQDERESQHDVADHEVVSRLGLEQRLDAVGDRHRSTGDEEPERCEQRPDVRLPAVPERMRWVGCAKRPAVGDDEEHHVARVRP